MSWKHQHAEDNPSGKACGIKASRINSLQPCVSAPLPVLGRKGIMIVCPNEYDVALYFNR